MSKNRLGTPSPGGLQVLTLLPEIIQSTLDSSEGGKTFLKWFRVLCISLPLLEKPEAQNSLHLILFLSLARHMVCMDWAEA